MQKNKLFQLATDPHQYDLPEVNWKDGGAMGKENPHRRHFLEYVEMANPDWRNQFVLDIGSGTGWLIKHVMEEGAALATGFDPSIGNLEMAQDIFGLNIENATIESYNSYGLTFDVAVAIYVLSHVEDLGGAFKNISSWLSVGGKFITIVPDLEYAKRSRDDFEIEVEPMDGDKYGGYTVRVKREHGSIADIVRDVRSYEEAALPYGLELTQHIEMKPTGHLLEHHPRYRDKVDTTLTHLLVFTKTSEI